MKKNISRIQKGFTLIEVVAVLGIITVMMMVTLVFMGQGRTDKELDTEANKVYSAIREAQNYSLTGESVESINSECNRIRFNFRRDGTFAIYNTTSSSVECGSAIAEYSLENGVNFVVRGRIHFAVPSGKTDVSGVYSIGLIKKNRFHNVCIYPAGAILTVANEPCPVNP